MAFVNWICVQFIGVIFWFMVLITAFAMMVAGYFLYIGAPWHAILAAVIQLAAFVWMTFWLYSNIRSYFNEKAMGRAAYKNEQK